MFNRSIKYLVLVIINIVIIAILIMGDDQKSDVFDTDYVITLLDSNKQLERQVANLSAQNKLLETSGEEIQQEILQTKSMIETNAEKLKQCRTEQASMLSLAEEQACLPIFISNRYTLPQPIVSRHVFQNWYAFNAC